VGVWLRVRYLWVRVNPSKFYLRVRSLPGVTVNPLFGPNLDSTAGPLEAAIAENALSGILERMRLDKSAVKHMARAHQLAAAVVGADDRIAQEAAKNLRWKHIYIYIYMYT